jgi:hypothetical protein
MCAGRLGVGRGMKRESLWVREEGESDRTIELRIHPPLALLHVVSVPESAGDR